jgi:hypothetical protein
MRAPLHLALLVSPIYLLLPSQHHKRSFNRETMVRLSTCLGNSKPQVVLDVEMAIWKSLFSLASGGIDPFDLLQKLSVELPWESIEAAPPEVSHWFNLGKFRYSMTIILLTFFIAALPAPTPRHLSLKSSEHIEDLPTSPETRPQVSFENSPAPTPRHQSSAHIEDLHTLPTSPETRPQVSFENSPAPTPRHQSSAHKEDLHTFQTSPERRPQESFEDSLASVITKALGTPSTAVNPALIPASGSSRESSFVSDHGHRYDNEAGLFGSDSEREDEEVDSPWSQEVVDEPVTQEDDDDEEIDDEPVIRADDENEEMDDKPAARNAP